jgi:hypothetical protein
VSTRKGFGPPLGGILRGPPRHLMTCPALDPGQPVTPRPKPPPCQGYTPDRDGDRRSQRRQDKDGFAAPAREGPGHRAGPGCAPAACRWCCGCSRSNAEAWPVEPVNAYLVDPEEYPAILGSLLHLGGYKDHTTTAITVSLGPSAHQWPRPFSCSPKSSRPHGQPCLPTPDTDPPAGQGLVTTVTRSRHEIDPATEVILLAWPCPSADVGAPVHGCERLAQTRRWLGQDATSAIASAFPDAGPCRGLAGRMC